MSKILRQNVGGVDFTMAGCALTGVCPTVAADYVKQITLSDGDVIEDGMMMVVTFANGNTAGNASNTKTIYSSDQINYYEDEQLTVPFTLAPSGCYEIEYTGTANAYTYTDYPVFQVGSVSGPVCDYRGHITSGDLWEAGDSVQCMLKEGKFLLLGGSGGTDIEVYDSIQDVIDDLPNIPDGQIVATKDKAVGELLHTVDIVEAGNMNPVTSNAVANLRKLVWTNPNPDVAMAAQTITFSESAQGYDFLEIEFSQYTNWRRHICKIPIGEISQLQCLSIQVGSHYENTRVIVTSTSTTIEIEGGMLNNINGTLEPDNNACIIERIWAVK